MASSLAAPMAHAAPNTFVYEGVLQDSSGPVLASTQVILRIYDPALSCLLYEEMQTVTPSADGSFSVLVGSELADAKRTSNDAGLAMSKIFLSSGAVRASGSSFCSSGYSAVSSDGRRLVVNINGVDLTPAIEISSAPFAISAQSADEALKVGGYDPTKLLRNDGINAVPALTDTNVDFLMSLLGGTLAAPTAAGDVANKAYVDSKASVLLPTTTSFAGDVSGTYNSLVVNKIQGKEIDTTNIATGKVLKYDGITSKWIMGADETGTAPTLADGKIWIGNASNLPTEVLLTGDATLDSAGVLTLKAVGTAGTKGNTDKIPQITTDAQGRVTAITELAVNDPTKLPLTGGVLSGGLAMGANNLTNVGHITMANDRLFQLSNGSVTPTAAGQMWYSGGSINYYDGSNTKTLGVSGAGISSFNGATKTIQTLATPGTGGNAPGWSTDTGTGAHTLNIPMANAGASVTAGLISNADYSSMTSKQSNALTQGQVWVGNASGGAEARALIGDVYSVSDVGDVTIKKTTEGLADTLVSTNSTGTIKTYGYGIKGATSGTVDILVPATTANYALTLPAATPANNQLLQTNGSGQFSWVDPSSFGDSLGNHTATTNLAMGTNSIIFSELSGNGTNYVGFKAPDAVDANLVWRLPSADGTANQVLTTNGSGALSWSSLPGSGVTGSAALMAGKIWIGSSGTNKASEVMLTGDATLDSTGTLTLASTGVGGGTTGSANSIPVITYDDKGRLTNVSVSAIDDTTKLPLSGGAMTGELSFVTNAYLKLPTGGGSSAGHMWFDGTNIKFHNGTSAQTLSTGGAGGTVSVADIQGTLGPQIPTDCTVAETMVWNSPADAFVCAEIRQSNVATFSTGTQIVYVSSSGDDINCNGSSISIGSPPDCPFQTLQKAVDSLPAIIRHPVSINLLTGLTATAGNPVMARIDKTVAAQSLTSGPLLTIQGDSNSVKVLNGANYGEVSGIVVSGAARGVYIKNIDFTNFTDTALRVEGGLAILENSSMNTNKSNLSVEDGGRLMLDGNIYIYLLSAGGADGSTGIRVSQASLISEAGLNMDIGNGQNNRGITIEHGSVSLESNVAIYTSSGTANYLSAVDVGAAGSLNIREGMALDITMNPSSTNMTAVNVRSGKLSVGQGGILRLSSIGGRGLICENSASCQIYGNLEVNSSNTSNPVTVQGNSIFSSQGNITFAGNPTNPGAYFEVSDNSTLKITPNGSAQLSIINSSGNSMTAFRLRNGAQVLMEPTNTHDLNNISGNFSSFFEVSGLSSVKANTGAAVFGSYYTSLQNLADESSRINISGSYSFKSPTRLCPAGMMSAGNGLSAFCIDTNNSGSTMTTAQAATYCSNQGKKICSREQIVTSCNTNYFSGQILSSDLFAIDCPTSGALAVGGPKAYTENTYHARCCQ